MKNLILLITLFLVFTSAFAQDLKKLDEKNGFRNYIFGVNLNQYPNLKEIEENSYMSLTDTFAIGDYKLKSITYNFYKNQLCRILIEIEGYSNSRGFLSILQKAYGDGIKPNNYMEKYIWDGKKVGMMYVENSITHSATVLIRSNQLAELQKKEKEEADKKATQGL